MWRKLKVGVRKRRSNRILEVIVEEDADWWKGEEKVWKRKNNCGRR